MIHLLSPGRFERRTGGYLYNERVAEGLRSRGHQVEVHALRGAWPGANQHAVAEARALVASLDSGVVLADGLLWTALAGEQRPTSRPVAVVVHSPLWREMGGAWRVREQKALELADHVVCTSALTARDLAIEGRAAIIEPGTEPGPAATGLGVGRILCVASIIPRKGHDVLLDALRDVPGAWTLRCAGSLDQDLPWVREVRAQSTPRVTWLGELDDASLGWEYQQADLLVSAARFEGWGMALAEGLVRGLPVVSTPAGVFEGRASHGAWLEVPPDDPASLAGAITRVLKERSLAHQLSEAALSLPFPGWTEQVKRLAGLLAGLD